MKTPATPLPWHMGIKQAERIVYDASGWAVCNATVYHGKEDAGACRQNAQYITHACNAYPRLVEALRAAYALPFAPSNNGAQWDEGFKRGWDAALDQVFSIANAALRDAGEQS